jgi:hypothetical protein
MTSLNCDQALLWVATRSRQLVSEAAAEAGPERLTWRLACVEAAAEDDGGDGYYGWPFLMSRREAERKLLNALAAGVLAATWDNDTLPRVWFERAEFCEFSNSLHRPRGGLGLKHTFDKPPMSVDGQVATAAWFEAAWPTFKLAELERVFPAPAPALQTSDMANVEVDDGRAESAGETPSPANGGAERGQAIIRNVEVVAALMTNRANQLRCPTRAQEEAFLRNKYGTAVVSQGVV